MRCWRKGRFQTRRRRTYTNASPYLFFLLLYLSIFWGCGGLGGQPPGRPPTVKGPDGRTYYVIIKEKYRSYYDTGTSRLQRIELDSNGDGRPDRISYHDGAKVPHLIEIDENFNGATDRWEYYKPDKTLEKIGVSRRGSRPDLWTVLGAQGQTERTEYDDDGDGRVDRMQVFSAGGRFQVQIDSDRDGRMDRWQEWVGGRLVSESLDTSQDGKPDRRIRYGKNGRILAFEPLG